MAAEKVKISAFIVQGLATIIISYLTALTSFVGAWPSYTLANFVSNETVLSHPMSSLEISALGSLANIGALVATPFCGYFVNTLGRKNSAILFGLPFVLAWLLISLTTNVYLVIASVGISGLGAAGLAVSPLYICEIAQDSIRGGLTSFVVTGYFFGLLLSYVLAGQLTYYQMIYVNLTLSVLYVLSLMLLKESPVFLVQNGKDEEAAKSLAFYRQVVVSSKEVELEINKIKLQLDPQIDELLQRILIILDPEVTEELINSKPVIIKPPANTWRTLRKSKSTIRALLIVLSILALSILMGAIVILVYAEPLFNEAVPSMSSNLCAIFLAIDLLIASLVCAAVVDRFGRRILMTSSAIGSGVFTVILAAQLQFQFAPHWFTVFLIYVYCFVYNVGAATVPYVLTGEVFLPEARGLCNSITMTCMCFANFVVLMIYNPLVESFGLASLFYGFSVICFLTGFFSHFLLPETKGLSVDAIQLLFLKKPKTRLRHK